MRYVYKTAPRPYQVRALKLLLRVGSGLLNMPMRSGKSKVAIDYCGCLFYKKNVRRVLVVTVTSGLGVWEDQIALHCPVPWRIWDWQGGLLAEKRRIKFRDTDNMLQEQFGEDVLDFIIVNWQNLYKRANMGGHEWVPVDNGRLMKFKADVVIADEVHHAGNPTAEQSKMLYRLGRQARFRVGLTGTPFHRRPIYVFGQAKFVDDGAALGSSFSGFKKRIVMYGGYGNYEVKRYRNLRWMVSQLKKWTFTLKHTPPGKPVHNILHFNLTGKGLKAYSDMLNDRVLELGDGTLSAEIILTLHLYLHMIAGGFVKHPDGKGYRQVGDDKIKMCEDRLGEYMKQGIEKAVVGCRFTPELRAVAQVAKKVGFKVVLFHGGVPAGRERTRRIKAFQEYDGPMLFISQISAGKESIDLSVADTMMHYSMSDSYVEFDQFCSRIYIHGDTRRLQHDFLIARGTQDQVTYDAMLQKKDVATYMLENPELVERITNTVEQAA